jgi:hypothetical protein
VKGRIWSRKLLCSKGRHGWKKTLEWIDLSMVRTCTQLGNLAF